MARPFDEFRKLVRKIFSDQEVTDQGEPMTIYEAAIQAEETITTVDAALNIFCDAARQGAAIPDRMEAPSNNNSWPEFLRGVLGDIVVGELEKDKKIMAESLRRER